jgi:hypothetical protein
VGVGGAFKGIGFSTALAPVARSKTANFALPQVKYIPLKRRNPILKKRKAAWRVESHLAAGQKTQGTKRWRMFRALVRNRSFYYL